MKTQLIFTFAFILLYSTAQAGFNAKPKPIATNTSTTKGKVYSEKDLLDLYIANGGDKEEFDNLNSKANNYKDHEFDDFGNIGDFDCIECQMQADQFKNYDENSESGEGSSSAYGVAGQLGELGKFDKFGGIGQVGAGGSFNENLSVNSDLDTEIETLKNEIVNIKKDHLEIPLSNFDTPTKPQGTIADISSQMKKYLDKVPNQAVKDGLTTYLGIIKADSYDSDHSVGMSNKGVGSHHANVISQNNKCYSTMVDSFYNDLLEIDLAHNAVNPSSKIIKRPNLYSKSGKGEDSDLQPGWLWDLAMKKAGNNPNIAMRIIGVCGHDDVSQGSFKFKKDLSTPEKKQDYIKNNLHLELSENMTPGAKHYQIENYMIQKNRILNMNNVDKYIKCPKRSSRMYLSNALGDNVSIDKKMKKRILNVQGQGINKRKISSKNYHIMGAAYMTCRLIEEGVHPTVASKMQKSAAWAYRTIRISSKIKQDLASWKRVEKIYNQYKNSTKNPLQINQFLREGLKAYLPQSSKILEQMYEDPSINPMIDVKGVKVPAKLLDSISNMIPSADYTNPPGVAFSQERFNKEILAFNAAKLFNKRYIGGDGMIPHTNFMPYWNRDRGTIKTATHYYGAKPIDTGISRDKPKGWTEKEYTDALHKVDTYLVDWEWTVKQHGLGADFAAENCKPIKYGDNIDDVACKALTGENENCNTSRNHGNQNVSQFAIDLNHIIPSI